jgi:GT2 family glycosyltransferase
LVIDAGGTEDPSERAADAFPGSFVKRVTKRSFGAAANSALGTVEGAAFFAFFHDDLELDPDVIQALVEEAFRSNAGIVGAKLLRADAPDTLESVGDLIDRFGGQWPLAELGERDQNQHDSVREVAVVSTAAMLVRCDLFADLRGFSNEIEGTGEALDLCWRARVAGARTILMPGAVVHHGSRSAVGEERSSSSVGLRNRVRTMLTCYSALSIARVLPQVVVLGCIEVLYNLVRGRFRGAAGIVSAGVWNLVRLPSLFAAHSRMHALRRSSDAEIRELQIRGVARIRQFLRTGEGQELSSSVTAAARDLPSSLASSSGPYGLVVVVGAWLFVLLGARSIVASGFPAIRDMTPLGDSSALLREWWSGWRSGGLGSASGAPTIDLVIGLLSRFGGWSGLLRTLLVLGPLFVGPLAAWRVSRRMFSARGAAAAVAAYVVNPLPYNAISQGRWPLVVAWALLPFIVGQLVRAGRWIVDVGPQRSVVRESAVLALFIAAGITASPSFLPLCIAVAACVAVSAAVGSSGGSVGRMVRVTAFAVLGAVVVHLPWFVAGLSDERRVAWLFGARVTAAARLHVADALQFSTGTFGGVLSLGLVVCAGLALLVAEGTRLRWAFGGALMVLASLGGVVVAARLGTSSAIPPAEFLLLPAAIGVAIAIGAGVDGVIVDVRGSSFGVRQLATFLGVVAAAVAVLSWIPVTLGGRFETPKGDLVSVLARLDAESPPATRTLWIGDGDALPIAGWHLTDAVVFGVTDGTGTSVSSRHGYPMDDGERRLKAALLAARSGDTARLGARLSEFGIEYVVLADRLAPRPYGLARYPVPASLAVAFARQADLVSVDVAPGVAVFQNLARRGVRSSFPAGSVKIASSEALAALAESTPSSVGTVLDDGAPPTQYQGKVVEKTDVVVAMPASEQWTLEVGGAEMKRVDTGSWNSAFEVRSTGSAKLRYDLPALGLAGHILQLLVLALLVGAARRPRKASAEPQQDASQDVVGAEEGGQR